MMKITHMMGFTHVGGWGTTLRAGRRAAGGAGLRCRGGGFQSKRLARLSKVRVQEARILRPIVAPRCIIPDLLIF